MVSRVPGYGQILSIWFLDYHVDLIILYIKFVGLLNYFLIGIEMGFTILNVYQPTW